MESLAELQIASLSLGLEVLALFLEKVVLKEHFQLEKEAEEVQGRRNLELVSREPLISLPR